MAPCRPHRILIIGHCTYASDDGLWSACCALRRQGHAVELLDPQRVPGILDGQGRPDDETLGAFRATFRPDIVACGEEECEQVLATLGAPGSQGVPAELRPRHFVVFGYVGKHNFGDELIFSVICERLRRRYPGCFVTLVGHDPQNSLRDWGVASVTPFDKADIDAALYGASALILMAGIMFDGPFSNTAGRVDLFLNPHSEIAGQAALTELAYIDHVPVVYLGVGAGPLENPDARRIVRLASLTRPRYVARDDATRDLLLACGVDAGLVTRKADLAFSIAPEGPLPGAGAPLPGDDPDGDAYVMVSLRDHESADEGLARRVAQALDLVWERRRVRALFVDAAPEDEGANRRVIGLMGAGAAAAAHVANASVARTVELICGARACLAMRLHCSIVASAQGVPCVGIDYNVKVAQVYRQLGREHLLLEPGSTSDEIASAVLAALDEGPRARQVTAEAVAGNRRLAEEAFDELFSVVDAHEPYLAPRPSYPRSQAYAEMAAHDLRARLELAERQRAELAGQLATARRELDEARGSTAWKVGRFVTWVPRRLKDLVRRLRR